MRGGRIVKISIFDIVVGDIVPLRIGDQVNVLMIEFVLIVLNTLGCVIQSLSWHSGPC